MPKCRITRLFVGTEPLSAMTDQYNRALLEHLPQRGIDLQVVNRLKANGAPISATTVRSLLGTGCKEALAQLVPPTTLDYLIKEDLL